MSLKKNYEPHEIEAKWYAFWQQAGYFLPKGTGNPYCIMLPPPNVTGTLHMGHAFQDTLMDALIRYHRMEGCDTLWQSGTDHAGIATQIIVERQLETQGQSKHDLGREAFVEKIWEWRAQSGGTIIQQMKRLGTSIDWSRERFTLDPGLSEAVTEAFVRLYKEGLIYKGKRLVNWDPVLRTAISDLEVSFQEEEGYLWHIRYPVIGSNESIVVATTRPETLLGDVAVAVHPDDPRYHALIGKQVALPLCHRAIPILADNAVDPDFGTGCVKITPGHDFNDYAMAQRHRLPLINLFTETATLNEKAPSRYQHLSRFDAREHILRDLEAEGSLEKVLPHKLMIPRSQRTHTIIEPYLTDQWFLHMAPLAQKALAAVQEGHITFIPPHWTQHYYQWLENIQDWCLSRQLWWGHRIPAWYDDKGKVYVGKNEAAIRQEYQLSESVSLMQDQDVLDTWFSSALWPFSSLGWPEKTPELERYYPTAVLVTGFDIIFFWVARMIMMGLHFMEAVPFRHVILHGLIQDQSGEKMSKSKGNVIDPLDLMDGITQEQLVAKRTAHLLQPHMKENIAQSTRKYFPDGIAAFGADALRFTLLALATTGRHIRFDFSRIEGYHHFCNKLWNAARYVLMHISQPLSSKPTTLSFSDQWILSVWQTTKAALHTHFQQYRFDRLSHTLYEFTWHVYCDWYLELVKPQPNHSIPLASQWTLFTVFEELLRTLHPLMPFITEAIWQKLTPLLPEPPEHPSIMVQSYPKPISSFLAPEIEKEMQLIQDLIMAIRNIRSEMHLSPHQPIPVLYRTPHLPAIVKTQQALIQTLAKVSAFSALQSTKDMPVSATGHAASIELFVPLAGLIDKMKERARLKKEIEKLNKSIMASEQKLHNPQYLEKAPPDVVEKERVKLDALLAAQKTFTQNLEKIREL